MFALVESGTITQFPKGNKGITIGDNQYPKTIYSLWTEAERNAIGIYTVEIDSTNKKSEKFWINTDITYAFSSGKVIGSYGTATAKRLNDEDAVDENGDKLKDADGNQVINYGLKTQYKNEFNAEAAGILSRTDWYVIKSADVTDYNVPSNIATYRAAVRTKVNAMETSIDNCSDVDALETLLTYTNTGTEEDPVITRPLGEFPKEVV
jgi:hypothetical protein